MATISRLFNICLVASLVGANPINRRAVIDSDAVVGFAETVPSGTYGDALLAYQPYLYVINGCVPFPAVDADGNTG